MIQKLMRVAAVAALVVVCISSAFAPSGTKGQDTGLVRSKSPRTVLLLDAGWVLHPMRGFQLWPPEPQLTEAQIKELHCPAAGEGWEPVQLPDDYVVKGDIARVPNASLLAGGGKCLYGGRECGPPGEATAMKNPRLKRGAYGGHGYLPLYPAWYRRSVVVPASARGKSVWLDFGGVYRDAVVFVNGQFVVQHPSGYTGFRLNVTSLVHFGAENEVTVFVDPRWLEGWFYEGGGIYRHVHLIITGKLQIAPWGTFVISKVPGPIHYGSSAGDQAAADLTIQTTVHNDHPSGKQFTLDSQIIGPDRKVIASTSSNEKLAAGQQQTFDQHVELKDALLWSLEHRNLYRLATTIRSGDSIVDGKLTTFGIRTIRYDPDHGFFLNGKHVEIQGACNHQGYPGVGIGVPDNLWAWRIAKLKAMGTNAYRCAHNPTAEAFYRAADRMGMLVMDENRHLGDTYDVKTAMGTPYSDLSDLKWMILAHRNHPSIIMWSLCNEEGLQKTVYGAKIFAAMKAAVDKIDPTRPTTSAMNGGYAAEGFLSVEGLLGMNYHNDEFAKIHAEYPHIMIYGSEDINSKTSRGTVTSSPETGLCAEYGCWLTPEGNANGGVPWDSWAPVMENSFVAGEFEWTGFDYRGEPNPFSWPAVTSQVGAMDLSGFPKAAYYYWKAWWDPKPSVYIFPSWNFPKTMDGQNVLVRAYSNCGQVELLLNGKSLGEKDMPRGKYLEWQVPYAPGVLSARGYDHGRLAAEYTVHTTGPAVSLRLNDEVNHLAANGEAVAPLAVEVLDAEGRVVPDADNLVRFTVSGAGTLAGAANGNPASHESNVASQRKAFRGLCMVLVRAAHHPGAITVTAQAAGLKPARIVIHTGPSKRAGRGGQ
jgi:beta-galactosidase